MLRGQHALRGRPLPQGETDVSDERANVDRRTFHQARLAILLACIGSGAVYALLVGGWLALGLPLR